MHDLGQCFSVAWSPKALKRNFQGPGEGLRISRSILCVLCVRALYITETVDGVLLL